MGIVLEGMSEFIVALKTASTAVDLATIAFSPIETLKRQQ